MPASAGLDVRLYVEPVLPPHRWSPPHVSWIEHGPDLAVSGMMCASPTDTTGQGRDLAAIASLVGYRGRTRLWSCIGGLAERVCVILMSAADITGARIKSSVYALAEELAQVTAQVQPTYRRPTTERLGDGGIAFEVRGGFGHAGWGACHPG